MDLTTLETVETLKTQEPEVITYTDYGAYKQDLKEELERSAESFVRIGYLLKVARDTNILYESGHANVNDFAYKEFGLDKTQVSRFIRINDEFSEGGYSQELRAEFKGFGYAKLSLMLLLPEAINEMLSPAYSKAEIQTVKEEVDEELKKTDIEVMLEQKEERQQCLGDNFDKAVYQLLKDKPDYFMKFRSGLQEGERADMLVNDILAPSGESIIFVRIPGQGKYAINVREEKDTVEIKNVRDPEDRISREKESFFCESMKNRLLAGDTGQAAWEQCYEEKLSKAENHEVAPVQPENPVQKKVPKVISAVPKEKPEPAKTQERTTVKQTQGQQSKEATENQQGQQSQNEAEETPETYTEQTLHDVNADIPEPFPMITEPQEMTAGEELAEETDTQIEGQKTIEEYSAEALAEDDSDYWKAKAEEYKADVNKMFPLLEQHIAEQHWLEVAQTANTIAQFARDIWKIGG